MTGFAAAQTPLQLTVSRSGNDIILTFPTEAARVYSVQYGPDLVSWSDLQTGIQGDGTVKMVTHTNALLAGHNFYQLLAQPGFATHLVVANFPSPQVAGVSAQFSVSARDRDGNIDTAYRGTVQLTSSDGNATLPPNYTFTAGDNGAHTFSATLRTAGTQSITATDSANSLTGSQANIMVSAAPAASISVSGFPSPRTAGVAGNFNVTVKDAFGNTATSYSGTVHFTSSDPSATLPSNYTFIAGDNGAHTFSATLQTAGSQSITATDTLSGSISGSQTGINIVPAGASSYTVSGFPSPRTAGVAGNFSVVAKDAFGNTATGYGGAVHFTSSDPSATLPANYTFIAGDNGAHNFSATLKTAGSQSITATDTISGSISGSQTGINITSAGASSYTVSGFPSPRTAGVAGNFNVVAKDAFGNTATGYGGTVHFTSSDPSATLPSNYTFVGGDNGAHTFSATLQTAGSQSITATDTLNGSISGSQTAINIVPAGASSYTVSGFSSPRTAGVAGNFSVVAKDAFGNTATGYGGTVHFTSSDPSATLPSNYTFVGSDNGAHTFSATLKTAGSQSITATDTVNGSITGSQTAININPAGAATLSVSGFSSPHTSGVAGSFNVVARDVFGNTATAYGGTVHFTSSDPSATLPANYTFTFGDAGAHSFSATLRTTGSNQSITVTDTLTGNITGTQTGITITP